MVLTTNLPPLNLDTVGTIASRSRIFWIYAHVSASFIYTYCVYCTIQIVSLHILSVKRERVGGTDLESGWRVSIQCSNVIAHPLRLQDARTMEAHQLVKLEENENIDAFTPGDTVQVGVRVTEANRTRTQVFEGVVIRTRGSGPGASFTVRRVSYEVGVERTFLLHSPNVEYVNLMRRGRVRRARLYYLRGRSGRAARIREDRRERANR